MRPQSGGLSRMDEGEQAYRVGMSKSDDSIYSGKFWTSIVFE